MKSEEFSYKDFMAMMKEIANMYKETDKQFKETDKQFKEIAKRFRETDRQARETDKQLDKLQELFTTKWERLVELTVTDTCLDLFKQRGIDIYNTYKHGIVAISRGKKVRYDVGLANDKEVIIVDVRTMLTIEYVDELLEKLPEIRKSVKSYADKKIYGAMAAISFDESSDNYAIKKGLFVIKNSGEGIVKLDNDINFKPTVF